MKLRIHDFDEAVDIRHIQEPAEALKGKMRFAVDCNQAAWYTGNGATPKWDLARARRFAEAAHDADLLWVEEPLFMEWLDQLAELSAFAKVPIAGGETQVGGVLELATMVEKRCFKIFQADAVWTGGIQQTL
jgi:L-alanine-DL-glutamate epimerase-like enolase superfamily enzyme